MMARTTPAGTTHRPTGRYRRRVVDLSLGATLAVDVVAWAVIGVVVGYGMHRVPLRRLDHDTWLTRARRFERGGRLYERIGIRRWKDRTPELGGLFADGVSKRSSGGRGRLDRYAAETRRAEYTHWLVMAAGPFFVLWNPWYLSIAMLVYAVVANLPCLMIQRYNRARIDRIAVRVAGRGTRPDGDGRAPTGT
jgi:glycosyl-4,4'-diaponeurosporenoate acyltransferase